MPQGARVIFIPQWVSFESEAGVVAYAREAGWRLSSIPHHGGDIHWVLGRRPDGIITLLNHTDSDHVRYIEEAGVPVVDMWNALPEIDAARVLYDNVAIGQMGANHLIDHGFLHLTFLALTETWEGSDRERGFAEQVKRRGRNYHPLFRKTMLKWKKRGLRFEGGAPMLASHLEGLPKPLGVMIRFDGLLSLVVDACKLCGLAIPDQVAVVGVNNSQEVCELGELPLSSVDPNRKQQGYEAAALLDRLMAGEPAPPEAIRVPPLRVVMRRSSDVLSVQNGPVLAALNYMHEHYRDAAVDVDEVVGAAGTSRRKLYGLFDEHVGRGIAETLTRIRVVEAQRLLVETDAKIFAVAIRTGFSGHERLIRSFFRIVGVTPKIYRERARTG